MDENYGCGCIFWLLVLLFVWLFIGGGINSKWRYAAQHRVSPSQVTVETQPHDCDFLKAPLGDKNCQYEPEVQIVRTEKNGAGARIVSYDDGKTWYANDGNPPVIAGVWVTWRKVER